MAALVVMPLLMVLGAAFAKGIGVWFASLTEPDALAALKLTLFTVAIVIPLNAVFGLLTAWAVTRFEFRGKQLLLALIDLPFAVSPVVAGLCLVLLFGSQRLVRRRCWQHYDIKILFARPGIVLATLFITFPFVVRELIPLMQQQGADEELAARSLGAGSWTMFRRVTLPNIKWGLLYGVLLCAARAMGEFGAVSVVSGPHPRPDQHAAAAHRDPLQRVRQHRRVRRGVAAGRARPDHPGPEVLAGGTPWRRPCAIPSST